jgi:glutamine amidotransferase
LHYIVRQSPFNSAHLVDNDITMDFSQVTTPNDRVALIATQPLTDNESWQSMAPGQIMLFKEGRPLSARFCA